MLKTKLLRSVSALFCAGLLLCAAALPVSANSAWTQWKGVTASGAVLTQGNCPLQVEKELLTFDLPELPKEYYDTLTDFLSYPGKVTAEYTVYNPTDYTVTAAFLFPFGRVPDYGEFHDAQGNLILPDDGGKYTVSANGQPIDTTIRHSFSYLSKEFDLNAELSRIADQYLSSGLYTPDQAVTKYTFTVSGVSKEKHSAATAAFDIPADLTDSKFYLVDLSGFSVLADGSHRLGKWVLNNGSTMTLYVIGQPPAQVPEWKFYATGAAKDDEEIGGTMTLTATETMTLLDFALSNWSQDSGVSQVDWYNALVCELAENPAQNSFLSLGCFENHFSGYLMRWYGYTLTLAPGQRMVNTVTAPIYPDINADYKPPIYQYTYLLSPAKTWASFGTLEIVVNTPYYLTDSSLKGFAATESGHALSLSSLPEGELTFTLCTDASPSKETGKMLLRTLLYLLPILLPGLMIAGVLAFIGWLIKGKRNTSR